MTDGPRSNHAAEHRDEPAWDQAKADGFIGKYILVGLTYVEADGQTVIRQVQLHGTVTKIERGVGVSIACGGEAIGRTMVLPPLPLPAGPLPASPGCTMMWPALPPLMPICVLPPPVPVFNSKLPELPESEPLLPEPPPPVFSVTDPELPAEPLPLALPPPSPLETAKFCELAALAPPADLSVLLSWSK